MIFYLKQGLISNIPAFGSLTTLGKQDFVRPLESSYHGFFRHKSTEGGIEKDAVRDMGAGFYVPLCPGKKASKEQPLPILIGVNDHQAP